MQRPTAATAEYRKAAILTAPPEQLHLMLLDGAIKHSVLASEAIAERRFDAMFNALDRAQKIVLAMNDALQREVQPALVDQMAALYNFIYMRLVDAGLHRKPQAIDDALRILRHQRETWQILVDKLAAERAHQAAPAGALHAGLQGVGAAAGSDAGFVAEG